MTTIALTSKIARQPRSAKAKVEKLECLCPDHVGAKRLPVDSFNVDKKYPKHGGRNTWCKECCKAYRAARKAESAKNDVQPIAAPRGRRTAQVPTPAAAPRPVVEAIANVNAAIEAAA